MVSKSNRFRPSIKYVGIGVAGDPKVLHDTLLPGLEEGMDGAVVGEDLIQLLHSADVVQLPEIQMVGLEGVQALFQELERSVPGPVVGLGGQEHLVPSSGHDLADSSSG